MLREYDVVHVYNPEFGVDYEAILIRLNDDGTALVRSENTGKDYSVDISDLQELAQPNTAYTGLAPTAAQESEGSTGASQ